MFEETVLMYYTYYALPCGFCWLLCCLYHDAGLRVSRLLTNEFGVGLRILVKAWIGIDVAGIPNVYVGVTWNCNLHYMLKVIIYL